MASDYSAYTMFCIDLGEEGMPITTLGLRPIDVHVNAMEHCYMLLTKILPSDWRFQEFLKAQGSVDQNMNSNNGWTNRMLARFGKGRIRIPWYIRTGPMSQGEPTERKRYRYLEIHGKGTVDMRIYVDGKAVARSSAIPSETPDHRRKINLPRGTKGYALDLEGAGDAELFGIELTYDDMPGES